MGEDFKPHISSGLILQIFDKELDIKIDWLIDLFLVFNATFSNISAISWRPDLVAEEAGVPGENHQPWASNWQTLSLAAASRVHPF